MKKAYEDIICLSRPVSKAHVPMSLLDRAAQFSPFAALSGYEDALAETARLTEAPIELDVDAKADLNEKLVCLQTHIAQSPQVTVTYFEPDIWKAGGAYVTVTDAIRRLNSLEKWLLLDNGTKIFFGDILALESPLFPTLVRKESPFLSEKER